MTARPTHARPGATALRPADLPALLGVALTDSQIAAAAAPLQPGLVLAGAGTGKTTVMAARVVWLVATAAVQPEQVLGLTFTTKAAGELAERIRRALRDGGLEGSGTAPEPTVATYHAYGDRLVREHGLRLGVEPRARLLSEASRFQLAGRVVRIAPGPFPDLDWQVSTVLERVVRLADQLADHLVEPEQVLAFDATLREEVTAALEACAGRPGAKGHTGELNRVLAAAGARDALLALVAGYRKEKQDLELVDFGDQIALAAQLAETCPEVGAAERAAFRVVLLDEYQDTSVAQARLLAALFGGGHPVTAVGDPCQGIYGWRGATVANLDSFPTQFPDSAGRAADRFPLTVNQRSGGGLLGYANAAAEPLRRLHGVGELSSTECRRGEGRCVVALHETWPEELTWIAGALRAELDEAGLSPRHAAVLVRARGDLPALRQAVLAAGLPVEVVGLGGLLTVPAVADVVATLEVLRDPGANPQLLRLLSGPRWRIGRRDLMLLGRRARNLVGPSTPDLDLDLGERVAAADPSEVPALADALADPGGLPYSAAARARFPAVAGELAVLRRHVGEPLLDLVHRVVTTSGLDIEVEASHAALRSGGREALAALADYAAAFTDLDGESALSSFLDFLAAAADYERGLEGGGPIGADAVQLLTVHQAKGLEWDVVAVPNLTDKAFPVERLEDKWTITGHVLPAPLRGDHDPERTGGALPVPAGWTSEDLQDYDAAERERKLHEELRLAYVALTRARRTLFASSHWWGATQIKTRGPSIVLTALYQHAEARGGEVAVWAEKPPQGTDNPCLAAGDQIPGWPLELDPVARAERAAAAAAVRTALAEPSGPGADDTDLGPDEAAIVATWDRDLDLLLEEALARGDERKAARLPRTLTASQLVRLASRPAELARELRRPMPRPPAPAATLGTRFHTWVQRRFELPALLSADDLPGAQDAGGDLLDAELGELQAAFEATEWADRPPYAVEAPFDLVLGAHVLRGRIDAVYADGDGRWHVVDWKTGREPSDPVQLAVYRLAWARLRGVPPDNVLASFLTVRTGRLDTPARLLDAAGLQELLDAAPRRLAGDPGRPPRPVSA